MSDVLVIGTQGISHRDDMVLRALVRLLDGGINIRARFSEQLEECNVVFVPANWPYRFPAPCITVGVKDPAKPDPSPDSACDLAVSTPLRMTNVIAVLQSATQRMHNVSQFDPVKGLRALFELLCERNRTAERSRAVVPMGSGQQIVFDFVKQLVHTAMPMDVLLSGAYTLGTPHRVSPVEEELIRSVPAYSLRHLVWQLALRLAQAGAVAPSRAGSYRLLRWPDAVGLAAPGHPRLAALWTNRALSLEQIRAISGVSAASVGWFLEACLALGLAVGEYAGEGSEPAPADSHGSTGRSATGAAVAAKPQPPAAAAPPGWLSHLRERLKLW